MARNELRVPAMAGHEAERWLVKSKDGARLLHRVFRKHWRRLISTAMGQRFVEYLTSQIEGDERHRIPVVVEINADGFVRVYGQNISVEIVNRLEVATPKAEQLAEELAWLQLPARHKEIYLNERRLAATGNVSCSSVSSKLSRDARLAILKVLSIPRKK